MNPARDVSVVIPALESDTGLDACLEALSRQSIRGRLEIIVSVDGEGPLEDEPKAMADVVIYGRHAGPAAARNRGWRTSAGRFVLFTDSDCVPERNWAEELVRVLEEGADAVKGVYSGGGDALIQRLAQLEFRERYGILAGRRRIDMVDTYSAGYRRSVLERTGGFDESFPFPDHEDVELSYRMESMGMDMRFVPEAAVSHTHRKTWSAYFAMKFSRGRWRMEVLRRFPAKAGSDSYTPRCLRLQLLLCLLLPVALALLPLSVVPAAAWAALFLLSCIPLAVEAAGSAPELLPLVPVFSLWRACALSAGMVRGILSGFGRKAK